MKPHVRDRDQAGTRGSPLALVQTRSFLRLLATVPDAGEGQEVIITTTGDAVQDRPLADIGGKGLFAKEIHEALLDGRIDCAVHSLKDLETELPPGIVLGCVLHAGGCARRADPRRRLRHARTRPIRWPPCRTAPLVGTSSVRRQAQLLHARPDLRVASIRGNVQTRLRKLREGECQASLLALAGLRRLDMEVPGAIVLDPEIMLPAAAQGIVGITVRAGDTALRDLSRRDRGPNLARRRDRRTGGAGGAGRIMPHADRRPCAPAGRRQPDPDRAGRPGRRLVPGAPHTGRSGRRRAPDRRGTRCQPARQASPADLFS